MLTGLADDLMAGDADERFELALELLVRGLEALRERRRSEDGVRSASSSRRAARC